MQKTEYGPDWQNLIHLNDSDDDLPTLHDIL